MHVASALSQVCRCLPFIHRIHQVDEVVTLAELRRIIKTQFLQYKDVKDPRVRMRRGWAPCMGCTWRRCVHGGAGRACSSAVLGFRAWSLQHEHMGILPLTRAQ